MSAPSPARDADDARSPVAVTPEPTTTSRDADAAADDDARARTPTTLAASFDAMTLRDRTNDATTRETKHARAFPANAAQWLAWEFASRALRADRLERS